MRYRVITLCLFSLLIASGIQAQVPVRDDEKKKQWQSMENGSWDFAPDWYYYFLHKGYSGAEMYWKWAGFKSGFRVRFKESKSNIKRIMPTRVISEETQRQKLEKVEEERRYVEELYKEELVREADRAVDLAYPAYKDEFNRMQDCITDGLLYCMTKSGGKLKPQVDELGRQNEILCAGIAYIHKTGVGYGLESASKAMAQAKNKEVAAFELKVAQKQSEYLDRLRTVQDSIATAQQVAAIGQDAAWWDKLIYNVENLGNTINNYAQRAVVATETKVSEWINDVIRFVGELIFQMSYYGILVAQRIFMAIMVIFCPIMFALSLAPPWNSAWSQWMSKFLSLSLWGFVTYMCLYYVDFILLYNLQQDLVAYDHLLHGSVNSWSQIGALGLQGIGSNCMYAMGMLVGAYIIRFVPEVASWLIPGGVSSGAATAAGSTATGIASMAGGAAGSVAGGAVSMVKPKSGR